MKLQKNIEKILLLQELFKVYVENQALQFLAGNTHDVSLWTEKKG